MLSRISKRRMSSHSDSSGNNGDTTTTTAAAATASSSSSSSDAANAAPAATNTRGDPNENNNYQHEQVVRPQIVGASTAEGASSSPWIRKPLSIVHRQESELSSAGGEGDSGDNNSCPALQRHLSVWDLIAIGVGGTVGSGIFVLTGQIASQYTGPSTFLSFIIAGIAATCSGVCYAELSGRIPASGSTYVYAYVCLGEVAAVVAASCLTLEYGVAGAAVARSWGDKVVEWLAGQFGLEQAAAWLLPYGGFVNLPAMLVSIFATCMLLAGVKESKQVTNIITLIKMIIILFMIIGGFVLFQKKNYQPTIFPFGVAGVFRGATSSFFAFLGYDEVCVVAAEAINPARDMPRAVIGTLTICTVCYVFAAVALTSMVHYTQISPTSGFPSAFATRGIHWAAQLTAIGELATLPVVVLVSLMAQPRVTLSMANDGLLPPIFARIDPATGNLTGGTMVAGTFMTVIATFIPFAYMDDIISGGILFAFCMTNSCLILLRCESPGYYPRLLERCLLIYNIACFVTTILVSHELKYLPLKPLWAALGATVAVGSLIVMSRICPQSSHFGGSIIPPQQHHNQNHHGTAEDGGTGDNIQHPHHFRHFKVPCVPYLPCLGMAVNWYLIAQLDALGIFLLFLYVGVTVSIYMYGCAPNSIGHLRHWSSSRRGNYEAVVDTEDDDACSLDGDQDAGINRSSSNNPPPQIQRANSFT